MELMITLNSTGRVPLYEQIYLFIRQQIRRGELEAGSRLPSTRNLADNLKVSRSTTQLAYDQLCSEGYLESIPCRGYFVCALDGLVEMEINQSVSSDGEKSSIKPGVEIDFSPRGMDVEHFPLSIWRRLTRRILQDDRGTLFLSGEHQGECGFRQSIARYLRSARGVNCAADQIVVGAGNEYLLMLLSMLMGEGRKIAMESPSYRQAYLVLQSQREKVLPLPMDQYGLDIRYLEKTDADAVYVMPSHQYPMGIVMPVRRRQELLRWADGAEGRYIIEDDYDSEFRYKGKPIPSLAGMDQKGKVVYLGTFSKSIAPAIRVGYLVLPPPLLECYHQKLGFYASTVSRIDQKILSEFLDSGAFERHLNRMRARYKAKHEAIMEALKPLEQDFMIQGEYAGLHLLLIDRRKRKEEDLIQMAEEQGAGVYGLSGFFLQGGKNPYPSTVVLGYGGLTKEEIRDGIRRLQTAWR